MVPFLATYALQSRIFLFPSDSPEEKGTFVLHLLNKTLINRHSKKQSAVETAAYGSEYSSTRTCAEQILDLQVTLRCLGAPIHSISCMFGDNKSVVDSNMTPHGKFHKRNAAFFHRM